jgi:hypothetical protein
MSAEIAGPGLIVINRLRAKIEQSVLINSFILVLPVMPQIIRKGILA